jgi:hypothetical protein
MFKTALLSAIFALSTFVVVDNVHAADKIILHVTIPTKRMDGSPLPRSQLKECRAFRNTSVFKTRTITATSTVQILTFELLLTEGQCIPTSDIFGAKCYDTQGIDSPMSTGVSLSKQACRNSTALNPPAAPSNPSVVEG